MTVAAAAARGGAVTLASQALKLLLMLGSTIVLGRLLPPEDFGVVAMATAVLGFGEIFRDFGLSTSALRARSLTQAQQSNLFWLNIAVGAVLTAIFFGASWLIASFYDADVLIPVVQLIALTFVVNGASAQFRVTINRAMHFTKLAIIDLGSYALAIAGAITLAASGAGYWSLVAQQLILSIGGLLLAAIFAHWLPSLPSRTPMGDLVGFGASLALTQAVSYLTRNADSIAIGRVWGTLQLGLYDRAYQLLVMPLNQIQTPMSRVAIPTLSKVSDDRDRYARYLRRAQLLALYGVSALFCVLAGVAVPLVPLILGERWFGAGVILSILAIGGVFRAIQQVSYWVFMTTGNAKQQLKFYLIAQPLLALTIVSGVPFGVVAVAVMHGVGYGLFWAASVVVSARVAQISARPFFIDAARSVLLFAAPGGALAWLTSTVLMSESGWLAVAAGVGASIIWFVAAALLSRQIRTDLRLLVATAMRAIRRSQ